MEQKLVPQDQGNAITPSRPAGRNTARPEPVYLDLVELFFVLLFNWKTLLLCLLAGAALMGFFHTRMVKPQYRAVTELYVTSTDSVISLQDLQIGSALTADYQNIIISRGVLNQVIDDLGLNLDYKALQKMITVSNPTGTHIIRANVTTGDLSLSRDIANALLTVSIDRIYRIVGTSEPTVIDYSEAEAVEDVTPSMPRYMLMGGMAGFALAALFFAARLAMNNTIKTEEDIKKYLQLPVLSAVPYFDD